MLLLGLCERNERRFWRPVRVSYCARRASDCSASRRAVTSTIVTIRAPPERPSSSRDVLTSWQRRESGEEPVNISAQLSEWFLMIDSSFG
jgi:hypothetical protein